MYHKIFGNDKLINYVSFIPYDSITSNCQLYNEGASNEYYLCQISTTDTSFHLYLNGEVSVWNYGPYSEDDTFCRVSATYGSYCEHNY